MDATINISTSDTDSEEIPLAQLKVNSQTHVWRSEDLEINNTVTVSTSDADSDDDDIPLAEVKANIQPCTSRGQHAKTAKSSRRIQEIHVLNPGELSCISILSMSIDPAAQVRAKALEHLAVVIEQDPSVLARQDIQLCFQNSFLDHSRYVREVAVNLVGKHMLKYVEHLDKYCEMLLARILDVGVGVRKRVIRALRGVCLTFPEFPKVPDICVKIVKRMKDDELTVRNLVVGMFHEMWFTAGYTLDVQLLSQRVTQLTAVVEAAMTDKLAMDCIEQVLQEIFERNGNQDRRDIREQGKHDQQQKSLIKVTKKIISLVVEEILRAEEAHLVIYFGVCTSTLLLFTKSCPQLVVKHVSVIQEYLNWKCQGPAEIQAVTQVANVLALVVPLVRNPPDSQLTRIEENCVKLIFKNDKGLIEACTLCLATVVNQMTQDYKLIRELFDRYLTSLSTQVELHRTNPYDPSLAKSLPLLRRAAYTVGLFLRYFDFKCPEVYGSLSDSVPESVFQDLLFILQEPLEPMQSQLELDTDSNSSAASGTANASPIYLHVNYVHTQNFCLESVGHVCIRYCEFMLREELKRVYQKYLSSVGVDSRLKSQTLTNIYLYLTEEAARMNTQDRDWSPDRGTGTLKEQSINTMDDVASGMGSTIIQLYLTQILEAYLHQDVDVRLKAARVIQLVVQQGLVNPVQIVPTLIAMSTDTLPAIADVANNLIKGVHSRYPQFIQSQVLSGFKLSRQLQERIFGAAADSDFHMIRGFRTQESKPTPTAVALNGYLYSILRGTKQSRRMIASLLLKQFSDADANLSFLMYLIDNLAHFSYAIHDEPLFILHHLDITVSVQGSNLLQAFEESLLIKPITESQAQNTKKDVGDADEENAESLLVRLPMNAQMELFQEFTDGYHICLLLLALKQHLKNCYEITDGLLATYYPGDISKKYEKPATRKSRTIFQPFDSTLDELKSATSGVAMKWQNTRENRRKLVEQYLQLKDLMLHLDQDYEEDKGKDYPRSQPHSRKRPVKESSKKGKSKQKRRKKDKRPRTYYNSDEEEDEENDLEDPDYRL